MYAFFVACAVLGGVLTVIQIALTGFGADTHGDMALDHADHGGVSGQALGHALGHGLDLFSARSTTAGLAFFGLAGAGTTRAGWPTALASLAAVAAGFVAMLAVAWLMRQLLRLEDDGSERVEQAVGAPATVYLAIPGERAGPGKVTLTLQGRTVEYQAVTAGSALPTGASVIVVDVVSPGTLEVVSTPEVGV